MDDLSFFPFVRLELSSSLAREVARWNVSLLSSVFHPVYFILVYDILFTISVFGRIKSIAIEYWPVQLIL